MTFNDFGITKVTFESKPIKKLNVKGTISIY